MDNHRTGPIKVLFLCTENSCRSQMAEGWARKLRPDTIEAYSAGVKPGGVNPRALEVMAEAGVDISRHRSKHVDELREIDLDYVITLCGHAKETCPVFPDNTTVMHAGFEDPSKIAHDATTEEDILSGFRQVRDEIRSFVATLPEALHRGPAAARGRH